MAPLSVPVDENVSIVNLDIPQTPEHHTYYATLHICNSKLTVAVKLTENIPSTATLAGSVLIVHISQLTAEYRTHLVKLPPGSVPECLVINIRQSAASQLEGCALAHSRVGVTAIARPGTLLVKRSSLDGQGNIQGYGVSSAFFNTDANEAEKENRNPAKRVKISA